jgi:hypothetical protein
VAVFLAGFNDTLRVLETNNQPTFFFLQVVLAEESFVLFIFQNGKKKVFNKIQLLALMRHLC